MTNEHANKEPKKPVEADEKTLEQAKEEGVPTLVTPLQPIARQVGEHVMAALDLGDTVAVLTTITGSRMGPQVVSIPLSAEHMQQIQGLLQEIHESEEPEHIPCVGFHCYVDNKDNTKDAKG